MSTAVYLLSREMLLFLHCLSLSPDLTAKNSSDHNSAVVELDLLC